VRKLQWSVLILPMAAMSSLLSSCGPFSSGPNRHATATVVARDAAAAVAALAASAATQNVRARLGDTAAAISNATGVSQDQTVVAEQAEKLRGYTRATAVTRATATKRKTLTAVRAHATAQAIALVRAQQHARAASNPSLTYAENLLNIIQTACLPGSTSITAGIKRAESILKTQGVYGNFSEPELVMNIGIAQFGACKIAGDRVSPPTSMRKARRQFDQAVASYTDAATLARNGMLEEYAVLLNQGAAALTRAGSQFDQLFALLRSGGA
jgi:hypothetical protein